MPGPDRTSERDHFIYSYLREREGGVVGGGEESSLEGTFGEEATSINDPAKKEEKPGAFIHGKVPGRDNKPRRR